MVITEANTNPVSKDSPAINFYGARLPDTSGAKVNSYQIRVGNKNVFNEPIEETKLDNCISLNHFKNAVYKNHDKVINASRMSQLDLVNNGMQSRFECEGSFVICGNFTYSSESELGMVQGISTAGLPIQIDYSFDSAPSTDKYAVAFTEVGYNLIIQNGEVKFVEVKSGHNF
jgi:hypothetical protein